MSKSLAGKVAIITGASSGMGSAMTRRLAQDGASIVIHYFGRREVADALVAEVRAAGGRAEAVCGDLTQDGVAAELIEAARSRLGGLDLLILNAGAPLLPAALVDTSEKQFDDIFAINVRANFHLLKHAVPKLRDKGRVIAFSTPYVVHAQPDRTAIAASKAALQAMVLGLSKEVGARGITANVVIPGATNTSGFQDAVPKDALPMIIGMTPLGRLGTPEDIADVIAFLCSNDARWITGQVLPISGGLL